MDIDKINMSLKSRIFVALTIDPRKVKIRNRILYSNDDLLPKIETKHRSP